MTWGDVVVALPAILAPLVGVAALVVSRRMQSAERESVVVTTTGELIVMVRAEMAIVRSELAECEVRSAALGQQVAALNAEVSRLRHLMERG